MIEDRRRRVPCGREIRRAGGGCRGGRRGRPTGPDPHVFIHRRLRPGALRHVQARGPRSTTPRCSLACISSYVLVVQSAAARRSKHRTPHPPSHRPPPITIRSGLQCRKLFHIPPDCATHARPLHHAASAFVSYGIVLVRVRVPHAYVLFRIRVSPGARAAHTIHGEILFVKRPK